jgi:hypothetical protein
VPLKLRGVQLPPDAQIPPDLMTPAKHKQLWTVRQADHEPRGKTARAALEAERRTEDPPDLDRLSDDDLEVLTAPTTQAPLGLNMRGPAAHTADPPRAATASRRAQRR